ncbi:MAG: YciI family protein [Alphaproteobacteria bacterium]
MPHYILAYRGGRMPSTPEEGAKHMAKWQAWVASQGDAMINPGTPLGKTKIVNATGVADDDGSNPWSGYCIVEAQDMDAALEIAKADPFLDTGGTLEVAELRKM